MLRRTETRLLILALAVMAVNALVLVVVKQGHDRRMVSLRTAWAAERQTAVRRITTLLGERVESHAADYSWWDDMVRQVAAPSTQWMDENLDPSLKTFGSAGWWIYRPDGTLLAARMSSGGEVAPTAQALPPAVVRALMARRSVARFFWRTSAGLLECAGAGVTTTADADRRLAPRGYFVAAHRWDQGHLVDLSTYCQAEARISPYDGEADGCTIGADGRVVVTCVFRDWAEQPVATLWVRSTADVVAVFAASRRSELWLLGISAVTMLLLLLAGLHRWVRRPLRAITASLAQDDERPLDRLRDDPTEFGQLAALVKTHFDQRGELRAEVEQRIAAEAQLQEALAAAQAAAEAKGAFLANMSHEIRTPMNGVLGMTALLLQTHLDAEQTDYARTIHASAEALLTVLNDILDFSKIEAGKLAVERVPFDLRQAVSDVADLLAVKADQQGIDLIVRYTPDIAPGVVGDPGRVRQILLNLVGNAIKFTRQGHVLISVSRETGTAGAEQRLRIEVQDTGVGIPEDRIEAIFGEFEQADNTTTRSHGGTGLGLAICRRLAELMGGTVLGISRVGEGSTFWASLPLPETHLEDEPPPASIDLRGVRALIIDDNEVNRFVLSEQLGRWGVERDSSEDPNAAIALLLAAKAEGRPYAVALLDHMMPGLDGEMLGRRIRAEAALDDVKLIMLTSHGRREDAERMLELGFSAYLAKPVRMSQLQHALATTLAPATPSPSPATSATSAATPEETPASAAARRVLVAEDNAVNQKVITRLLEKMGCQVTIAADGVEAVAAAASGDWDVLLMDCQMPNMDGYDATRAIRDREAASGSGHLPIVAMTANALAGDRETCLDCGMDDYLAKPVRPADVVAALDRWAPLDSTHLN
ncbi:MAG: response regulator [Armatimonadetes bacterium]|nr:response regulator [Armatimonadota bacterium]